MTSLFSIALASLAGLTAIPVIVFVAEVAAALLPVRRSADIGADDILGSICVLIPAHNESFHLVPTLKDVRGQLRQQDRLLVVADNCSDDTAAIAAAHGAEVLRRNDHERIGKGYALAHGLSELQKDPPSFVIFIDADCRVPPDTLASLRVACKGYGRPVQACFTMKPPQNSPINHCFGEFAWIIKNQVRPMGLWRLRCPVQLMGTGMIFSWDDITSVSLASGHLVEDLKLGLDLASKGKAPRFLPSAVVTSFFPTSAKASATQRLRWVRGHLSMVAKIAPGGFLSAILHGNFEYFVLLLDLIVPPLSLFGLLLVIELVLFSVAAGLGLSSVAMKISALSLAAFVVALGLAWMKSGRQVLPLRQIGTLVPAVLDKLFLYSKIFSGRSATQWIRTDRGHAVREGEVPYGPISSFKVNERSARGRSAVGRPSAKSFADQ